mmetsp:Transcript_31291/g.70288  ORF Transcript_31291/g.70288 Transcript_31291/m.70288 type:complete len:238 (+) Transcript_31291:374-1087(+)
MGTEVSCWARQQKLLRLRACARVSWPSLRLHPLPPRRLCHRLCHRLPHRLRFAMHRVAALPHSSRRWSRLPPIPPPSPQPSPRRPRGGGVVTCAGWWRPPRPSRLPFRGSPFRAKPGQQPKEKQSPQRNKKSKCPALPFQLIGHWDTGSGAPNPARGALVLLLQLPLYLHRYREAFPGFPDPASGLIARLPYGNTQRTTRRQAGSVRDWPSTRHTARAKAELARAELHLGYSSRSYQ